MKSGELLTVKELAFELKRHPSYVYAMRAKGFQMPGNRTTLEAALAWLEKNPAPCSDNRRKRRRA